MIGRSAAAQGDRTFAFACVPGICTSSAMGELDLLYDLRGGSSRDRMRREVPCHDRIRADDAALADRDAACHDNVHAEPAVVAYPGRALRREALPGDGLLGIIEAV